MLSFWRSCRAILSALLFCCCSSLGAQITIHIPADQPTIQAGINAAHDGDTVLVAPGTYYENIDFFGKAITVTSSDGPSKTVIDGGSHGTVVRFVRQEPRSAVLSNFTITHGGGPAQGNALAYGVGIAIGNSSSPTLLNNVITENYCINVISSDSNPLIQGNVISSSLTPEQCPTGVSGGVMIDDLFKGTVYSIDPAQPTEMIIGNTIENNRTGEVGGEGGIGGGIGGYPGFEDGGPGISVFNGGRPQILWNTIRNNWTRGYGGGIYTMGGIGGGIAGNLIYNNTAGCGGGAIASNRGWVSGDTFLLIANNTIVNNKSGPSTFYSDCRNVSEFFVYTPAPNDGSEASGPSIKFVNNILHANASPAMDCSGYDSVKDEAHQAIFDHNLIYDSAGPFMTSSCVDITHSYGNMTADPQFVNPGTNDFHLQIGSPAIDAGNSSALAMLQALSLTDLTKDIDGNLREQDTRGKGYPVIDIGAYEYAGLVNNAPTRVVLSSSLYQGPAKTPITLTASFSSALGVPTGSATFFMDEQQIGTATIGGSGIATLTDVRPSFGPHTLYGVYTGQGAFSPATSVVIVLLMNRSTTSLSLTGTPSSSFVGKDVSFTLHASSIDTAFIPSPIQILDGTTPIATVLPDASGTATFTHAFLSAGSHVITAEYAGDATHIGQRATWTEDVIDSYPVQVSITSTGSPSRVFDTVTFTAQVTSNYGTPSGIVSFIDSAADTEPVVLDANGIARWSTSSLLTGTHTITAKYNATGDYGEGSASLQQTVVGRDAEAVLSVNPTSIEAGDSATLTATVMATNHGNGIPQGTVTFYSNVTALATTTLNSAGVASIKTADFAAGSNQLTCKYMGNDAFSAADCNIVLIDVHASDTTLTIASSANPTPALSPVNFTATLTSHGNPVAGTVVFYVDGGRVQGAVAGGTGITSISLKLPTGIHTVRAEFAGNNLFNPSSATTTETAVQNPTTTTLLPLPPPIYENQKIEFSVMVKTLTGSVQPYGTLTLMEGAGVIGTQTISASQSSSSVKIGVNSMTAGTHTVVAIYTPADNNFGASTSLPATFVVLPQTFLFDAESPSITIQAEHHASMMMKLTSVGGWTGDVYLGCEAPLPPVLTCTIEPRKVLAPDGSVEVKLSLETDVIAGFKSEVEQTSAPRLFGGASIISLAGGLLLPFVCLGRRRRWTRLTVIAACLSAFAGLNGCGSKYPAHTPPGTYTITLKAHGTAYGAVVPTTKTVQVELVVTP